MSDHPPPLSDRPKKAEPETDVLTDILETMRLTNLIYGRFELGAPWGLSWEASELAQFYLVVRGNALLQVEGTPSIALSAGDVVVLPGGPAHALLDAPGSPVLRLGMGQCRRHAPTGEATRLGGEGAQSSLVVGAFQFLSGRRTSVLERLPPVIHLAGNDPRVASWLPALVQLIVAESTARRPGGSVVVSRLADVLLVQALRSQMESSSCKRGLPGISDPQIGAALGLMHGRPGEAWTVESLAQAVGLSRSGFAARFTELVGEPPLQYLARWRMTKAAQHLREGAGTIAQVAEGVGYYSEASFNRAFKRWEGKAPGAYRREQQLPR